ncbi:Acyl-protein thioesterase 1-like protein [Cladobotryum mycophilum]|uniref:Acyl-protein thioesterase 1-like protein n=1 Tax=Cladobotryum mycophilum TaxID=491253 RepID=A0ABR0SQD3_9HYPO
MKVESTKEFTIIIPANHTHTVVFLHGRGDNAKNFYESLHLSGDSQGRTLFDAFPTFKWVFPQAPTREAVSNGSKLSQWFDVYNVQNFAMHEELQAVGLKEVVPAIRRILANEASTLGGRWDRVVLAGISMGAATSVHMLFNLNVPPEFGGLAAFMGFSCRCPFYGRTLPQMRDVLGLEHVPAHNEVLRNTPMLLEHCTDDALVRVENGRLLRDTLRAFGATVDWIEYPNGGHWFNSPSGMDTAVEFLNRHVLKQMKQPQSTYDAMDSS